jgi:uncharacterized heparinase superfamily protein
VTPSRFEPDFERAFIALRYFVGARGDDLAAPLGGESTVAAETLARLRHEDRQRRAEALAVEVGRVVRALDARTLR